MFAASFVPLVLLVLVFLLGSACAGPYSSRTVPYIPASDAAFDAWALNFSTVLTANPATYDATSGMAGGVTAAYSTWHAAYLVVKVPSTKTKITVAAKQVARAALVALIRPIATRASADPAISIANKVTIGITPRTNVRTRQDPPQFAPGLMVLQVSPGGRIRFRIQHSGLNDQVGFRSRGKPQGVVAVQIGIYVGDREPELDELLVCGSISKNPGWVSLGSVNSGKPGWFAARYMTRRGEYSSWGPLTPCGIP